MVKLLQNLSFLPLLQLVRWKIENRKIKGKSVTVRIFAIFSIMNLRKAKNIQEKCRNFNLVSDSKKRKSSINEFSNA